MKQANMVVMYYFAFWFTTRFGSIAVGFFSLIQSLIVLISCSVGLDNQEKMKKHVINWIDNCALLFMKDSLQNMVRDPELYLGSLIAFHTMHSLSCLLLIYGAYKITVCLVYPFIVLELVRLILLTVYFIIAMILYKENVLDLGMLIGLCCMGGFGLLFLYYCWFCVISFAQIVKQLELSYRMEHDDNIGPRGYPQMNAPPLGMGYYDNVGGISPATYYNRLEPKTTQNMNRFATNFSNQYSSPFRNEHNYYNALTKPAF